MTFERTTLTLVLAPGEKLHDHPELARHAEEGWLLDRVLTAKSDSGATTHTVRMSRPVRSAALSAERLL